MPKISYPFAAIPNQVCRGGHGAINVAVLAVMLSHGRTTASGSTLAREVGCSRASVFEAIAYWIKNGPEYGIAIKAHGGGKLKGTPTIYEIIIHRMETGCLPAGHPGVQNADTRCLPAGHKEEPIRRKYEENSKGEKFKKFREQKQHLANKLSM